MSNGLTHEQADDSQLSKYRVKALAATTQHCEILFLVLHV